MAALTKTATPAYQPLCSGGATAFYQDSGRSDFLEVSYSVAPARIQRALAVEVEFLRGQVQGQGEALEVGCGNGRLLEALRQGRRRWVGVDLQPGFLLRARSKGSLGANPRLAAALAWGLPFADASFDVVVCAQNTLGLMGAGKPEALREAKRVTRPGGRLVFVVYSESSLVPRLEWYARMHRRGQMASIDWARSGPELLVTEDGHGSECFRRERLEQLFTAAGLAPEIEPLGEIYWAVRARRV